MLNKKEEKLRAAIYFRVSTDEQAKEGYSLAFQEEKLKNFVASQDYVLDDRHIYRDEGFSGTLAIENRPALSRLFGDAAKKQFDVVLVYRLDRFFRKTRFLLEALDALHSLNIGFRSITESFDTTNITGRFMTTLLGAVAEMERETIKERTQGGRRMAAQSGKWIWGSPPYGYRLDTKTKKLAVFPEEAKWVRKFFEWIVNERISATAVLKRANMLKAPCYKKRKRRKAGMEGIWHKRSITRILSNPIYTGTDHFFRFKRGRKDVSVMMNRDLQHDESQWIEFHAPPIISRDLFDRCQTQLLENRESANRNLKSAYLFNKLIRCGVCGMKMHANQKPPHKATHTIHKFYQGSHLPKWREIFGHSGNHKCGDIAESRLESVWQAIKNLLENPTYTITQLGDYMKRSQRGDDITERSEEAEKKLAALIKRSQKIDKIYLENDSLGDGLYKKQKAECRKEIAQAEAEINVLRQRMLNKKEIALQSRYLSELYMKIKDRIRNATYEDKSRIIHALIHKITLLRDRGEVEIEAHLPRSSMQMLSAYALFVTPNAMKIQEFVHDAMYVAAYTDTKLWDGRIR